MEAHPYERDFKGVWIPKEIWLSRELSLMEKVLFVEIHSLDNARGCFASNRHFADFFDVSDRQIRNYIGALREKGFITVTITNHHERVIRTAGKYARVSEERLREFDADYKKLETKMGIAVAGGGRKLPRG